MIKARVLSVTMSTKPDAPIEMGMEMYVPDDTGFLSCPATVFIMKEEEYKALDSVSDVLRKSLLDEREKTRKLKEENEAIQKDIKDLEEKLAQEAAEIDIHPNGTIVFRNKRVSELEKEVEKLRDENHKLAAKNIDIQYERTITKMTNSRLSEIVKEYEETIKKLKEENKALKER